MKVLLTILFVAVSYFLSWPFILLLTIPYTYLINPYVPLVVAAIYEYQFGLLTSFVPWHLLSVAAAVFLIEWVRPRLRVVEI